MYGIDIGFHCDKHEVSDGSFPNLLSFVKKFPLEFPRFLTWPGTFETARPSQAQSYLAMQAVLVRIAAFAVEPLAFD
jgi:hypothetical protein